MKNHITILGALYIAFGLQGIVAAAIVLLAVGGGGILSGEPDVVWITSTVAIGVACLLFVLSLPSVIAGIGLIRHKAWARIVALIVGAFYLLCIPFGTALAIYTIWVLMQDETTKILTSDDTA